MLGTLITMHQVLINQRDTFLEFVDFWRQDRSCAVRVSSATFDNAICAISYGPIAYGLQNCAMIMSALSVHFSVCRLAKLFKSPLRIDSSRFMTQAYLEGEQNATSAVLKQDTLTHRESKDGKTDKPCSHAHRQSIESNLNNSHTSHDRRNFFLPHMHSHMHICGYDGI